MKEKARKMTQSRKGI